MFPPAQNSISPDARRQSTDSTEFVTAFARAYTLSEIFPLHHPMVEDAMRDVAGLLPQLSKTVLQISRTGIETEASAIADAHGHLREFARDLSLAGVSEIGLGQELGFADIERFLAALRVVTEDPEVGLSDFLSLGGGCAVELAFHGGPRAPAVSALEQEAQAEEASLEEAQAERVRADEGHAETAWLEEAHSEVALVEIALAEEEAEESVVERIEPLVLSEALSEWTVEDEIDNELQLEPLGAFLSAPSPVPEDDGQSPDDSDSADPRPESAVPAERDWRTEVHSRLLLQSQVKPDARSNAEENQGSEVDAEANRHEVDTYEDELAREFDVYDEYTDADLPLDEALNETDAQSIAQLWGADPDANEVHPDDVEPVSHDEADLEHAVDESPVTPVLDEYEVQVGLSADPVDARETVTEDFGIPATGFEPAVELSTDPSIPAAVGPLSVVATNPAPERAGSFSAALGDVGHPPVGAVAEVLDTEEHQADVAALWDTTDSIDVPEIDTTIEEIEAPDESSVFDEMAETFPGVAALAPEPPALVVAVGDVESGLNSASAPAESTWVDPGKDHPEIALPAPESVPAQYVSSYRSAYSDLKVDDHQDPTHVTAFAVAEPVTFAHLAGQFVAAQESERPALRQRLDGESSRHLDNGAFEEIAAAIDVLVRKSVPGDHASTDLARSLATPSVIKALCTELGDVRDSDRRDEMVYVFGELSPITAPALATELSEVPPRAARRNFMDALFTMRADAIAVSVPMLDDSRWFIVRNGVDILGEAGNAGSVAKLAPSLAHPDHRVRRATVMALAKLGGERVGNELIPVLEDPNPEVREAVAMALGHLRCAKALRPMLALLEQDKDDETQMVILRSLGQIGDPGAVPAIEKRAVGFFFIKPNKAVRIAAYRALAGIGTPHARSLVKDAVGDRDAEVAATAHTLAAQLQDDQDARARQA